MKPVLTARCVVQVCVEVAPVLQFVMAGKLNCEFVSGSGDGPDVVDVDLL